MSLVRNLPVRNKLVPVELSLIERCPLYGGHAILAWHGTAASVLYREVFYIGNVLYRSVFKRRKAVLANIAPELVKLTEVH